MAAGASAFEPGTACKAVPRSGAPAASGCTAGALVSKVNRDQKLVEAAVLLRWKCAGEPLLNHARVRRVEPSARTELLYCLLRHVVAKRSCHKSVSHSEKNRCFCVLLHTANMIRCRVLSGVLERS